MLAADYAKQEGRTEDDVISDVAAGTIRGFFFGPDVYVSPLLHVPVTDKPGADELELVRAYTAQGITRAERTRWRSLIEQHYAEKYPITAVYIAPGKPFHEYTDGGWLWAEQPVWPEQVERAEHEGLWSQSIDFRLEVEGLGVPIHKSNSVINGRAIGFLRGDHTALQILTDLPQPLRVRLHATAAFRVLNDQGGIFGETLLGHQMTSQWYTLDIGPDAVRCIGDEDGEYKTNFNQR